MFCRYFGIFAAFVLFGIVNWSTPAQAATNVLFILDGSGSMWEHVDGQPKIVTAKKALDGILRDLPPDTRLGLMSYGLRRKGDCSDIELISPIGSDNARAIVKKVDALQPKGDTPIAAALMQAAAAFKGIEGQKVVVLVTDGAEECKGDPCAASAQLAAANVDLHVNVVGFNLARKEHDAVQCIAKNGHGNYYDAKDAKSLSLAMNQVKANVIPHKNKNPYSAVGDFYLEGNPNDPWSYLYSSALPKFSPLSAHCSIPGMACWGTGSGTPHSVVIGKNTTGDKLTFETIVQPVDALDMDPQGDTSILRFTAPEAHTYAITGYFSGIDTHGNSHPVAILLNGVSVFSATIATFGQKDGFSLAKALKTGDTIDFEVLTGSAGCAYCYLSTGFAATISAK